MSSDNQYTALGPAVIGFQTSSTSIDRGADISGKDVGVAGQSQNGEGVHGQTGSNMAGVAGVNTGGGQGVFGFSERGEGVHGQASQMAGVAGVNTGNGQGVWGQSQNGEGVHGQASVAAAVAGVNTGSGPGVVGQSQNGEGVHGQTSSNMAGVAGINTDGGVGVFGQSQNGIGVFGKGTPAGRFEGNVQVTGDIQLVNGDCAEEFDILSSEAVEPGTVMTLCEGNTLQPSLKAYDHKVVGIISGAGDLKPGIVLGKKESDKKRLPIALIGRAYCKVDARYSPIEIGDLLTTSSTPGHAMKANDPLKAFGAVIGKALMPLDSGKGMIPILIALQ